MKTEPTANSRRRPAGIRVCSYWNMSVDQTASFNTVQFNPSDDCRWNCVRLTPSRMQFSKIYGVSCIPVASAPNATYSRGTPTEPAVDFPAPSTQGVDRAGRLRVTVLVINSPTSTPRDRHSTDFLRLVRAALGSGVVWPLASHCLPTVIARRDRRGRRLPASRSQPSGPGRSCRPRLRPDPAPRPALLPGCRW